MPWCTMPTSGRPNRQTADFSAKNSTWLDRGSSAVLIQKQQKTEGNVDHDSGGKGEERTLQDQSCVSMVPGAIGNVGDYS